MSNIIDSIQLSGTVYTIQGTGGGGSPTVELTQAEYDALVSAGTVSANTYYIITDATAGDLTQYVTTDTEQTISGRKIFTYSSNSGKAIEFKQTSDSAKVGFKIINSAATNNEVASFEFRPNTFTIDDVQHPLMYFGHYRNNGTANAGVPQTVIGFRQYDQKNAAAYHYLLPLPEKAKTPFSLTTSLKDYYAPMGFKVDSGGTMVTTDNTGVVDLSSYLGGGKAISAGTNISVTTGETADTVSCTLPITANSAMVKSVSIGAGNSVPNQCDGSIAVGYYCSFPSTGADGAAAIGWYCNAKKDFSFAQGNRINANNVSEHSVGQYNVSSSASTTFGDSGNTLFSVGNGTADNARHNAFEIRQNGDIYFNDGTNDVKLQDKFSTIETTIGDINTLLSQI